MTDDEEDLFLLKNAPWLFASRPLLPRRHLTRVRRTFFEFDLMRTAFGRIGALRPFRGRLLFVHRSDPIPPTWRIELVAHGIVVHDAPAVQHSAIEHLEAVTAWWRAIGDAAVESKTIARAERLLDRWCCDCPALGVGESLSVRLYSPQWSVAEPLCKVVLCGAEVVSS